MDKGELHTCTFCGREKACPKKGCKCLTPGEEETLYWYRYQKERFCSANHANQFRLLAVAGGGWRMTSNDPDVIGEALLAYYMIINDRHENEENDVVFM